MCVWGGMAGRKIGTAVKKIDMAECQDGWNSLWGGTNIKFNRTAWL